jgi:hypothetical protein
MHNAPGYGNAKIEDAEIRAHASKIYYAYDTRAKALKQKTLKYVPIGELIVKNFQV